MLNSVLCQQYINLIFGCKIIKKNTFIFSVYFIALRERAAVEGIKPTTEKTHRGNPIKRAKWHLGIRSQSKPQDIMNEVYRAMKTLNFVRYLLNQKKTMVT